MKMKTAEIKQELKSELGRVVDILIRSYDPARIILFGSLAKGRIHEGSDIDLFIIKETNIRFIERLHAIRLMTRPRVGVDFIVVTPAEAEEMKKKHHGFFQKEILEKGEVLYAKTK